MVAGDYNNYREEIGGQYSFLSMEDIVPVQNKDSFNDLIRFSRKGRKKLLAQMKQIGSYEKQKLDSETFEMIISDFKRDFDIFIAEYFYMFDQFDYEEILKKYVKRATDYHNLGVLFRNICLS